jgi:hypothetical protein
MPPARAAAGTSGALEDRFLPVQGKVIGVLGYQHLRQQSRGGQPLVDDVRRHRRLHQGLARRAHPFAADVPLDGEDAGGVVELLGDVLADALQLAAAAADGRGRLVTDLAARQVRRQRLALRLFLRTRARRGGLFALDLAAQGLEILVDRLLQQALLLAGEGFALRSEHQPPEHRHLVGELLDDGLLVPHLGDQPGGQ